jgi:hypothetical protein
VRTPHTSAIPKYKLLPCLQVRELKKRQQKQLERERKLREKALEKERAEREAAAKLKAEHDAYELKVRAYSPLLGTTEQLAAAWHGTVMAISSQFSQSSSHPHDPLELRRHPPVLPMSLQVAALAPKVEAMEASWNRIRTISGAETAEDVITYWEGLKAKEEQVSERSEGGRERGGGRLGQPRQCLHPGTMYIQLLFTVDSILYAGIDGSRSPCLVAKALHALAACESFLRAPYRPSTYYRL